MSVKPITIPSDLRPSTPEKTGRFKQLGRFEVTEFEDLSPRSPPTPVKAASPEPKIDQNVVKWRDELAVIFSNCFYASETEIHPSTMVTSFEERHGISDYKELVSLSLTHLFPEKECASSMAKYRALLVAEMERLGKKYAEMRAQFTAEIEQLEEMFFSEPELSKLLALAKEKKMVFFSLLHGKEGLFVDLRRFQERLEECEPRANLYKKQRDVTADSQVVAVEIPNLFGNDPIQIAKTVSFNQQYEKLLRFYLHYSNFLTMNIAYLNKFITEVAKVYNSLDCPPHARPPAHLLYLKAQQST